MNADEILGRIAAASLRKCAQRLSRVSTGTWDISGVDVSMGSLEGAVRRHSSDNAESVAVYFDVKGELPFAAILLFDPRDIERVAGAFLGRAFMQGPDMDLAAEEFLSDLGNIILNSFVGALSDALERMFLPSTPRCIRGEPRHLLEAMEIFMDVTRSCRIVCVELSLQCGGSPVRTELLGLIPEKLEREILNSRPAPEE